MDAHTMLDEIDEAIAHIEMLNRNLKDESSASDAARQLLRSRMARLAWLRQVRGGMLAKRPRTAPLH